MIALDTTEETGRVRTRAAKKAADQAGKIAPARLAKSKDSNKTKVTFYLDASVAAKLGVSAIIRRVDQSDVANEILSKALSSVTYYDRPVRASDQSMTVSEIGHESAA